MAASGTSTPAVGSRVSPKTRLDYWLPKLARNVERDGQARTALEEASWRSLVVWECETRDREALRATLRMFLLGGDQL